MDEIQTGRGPARLASGLAERLEQLGMSRRELARRSGLSRQTIHNIERAGSTPKESTLRALDAAVKWPAGTALALATGQTAPSNGHARTSEQLARIQLRLSQMDSSEIELTLIMLEEHHLGNSMKGTWPAA